MASNTKGLTHRALARMKPTEQAMVEAVRAAYQAKFPETEISWNDGLRLAIRVAFQFNTADPNDPRIWGPVLAPAIYPDTAYERAAPKPMPGQTSLDIDKET